VQVVAVQSLTLANNLLMLAVYTTLSLLISPGLTAVAAVAGIVLLVVSQPLRRRAHRFGVALGAQNQAQIRVLTDFLGGLKAAKCLNAETSFRAEFSAVLDETQTLFLTNGRIRSDASAISQVIGVVALSAIAYFARAALNLSFVAFSAFIVVILRVVPRMSLIQSSLQELLSNLPAIAALQRFETELAAAAEPAVSSADALPPPCATIGLRQVSFAYPSAPQTFVLDRVDISLPVGSITSLVGRSGSGKSTVADLLAGLLRPTRGGVALDDRVLREPDARDWRRSVAYVTQDGLLLNRTIAENLALGHERAPADERIWAALESACAADFVRNLPEGLHTPVGERGVRLSGGERQRIMLARALIGAPRLLILDEATSAVDAPNQRSIAEAIRGLRGGTTVLIIAHSMALVSISDQVVELAGGRVVASGDLSTMAAGLDSVLAAMRLD